jgi:hypothetical protein
MFPKKLTKIDIFVFLNMITENIITHDDVIN